MLSAFRSTETGILPQTEITDGCWVRVVEPAGNDVERVRALGVPPALLSHVLDLDERPRAESEGSFVLIVFHVPVRLAANASVPYRTQPLSIILGPNIIVTIAHHETAVLQDLAEGRVRHVSTTSGSRFVLQLLFRLAEEFLAALRTIDDAVEQLEDRLQHSLRNQEVMELLRYEKSLVYFTTALKSNELVLERLSKGHILGWPPEEADLLDDVSVEIRQAIEMVDISQNILSQMMDAFASIVSNNLNEVMKILTAATIIVALPTLIASLYGMNVALPGSRHPLAFAAVLAGSLLVAALLAVILRRKKWL
jgi:magnesium transporter